MIFMSLSAGNADFTHHTFSLEDSDNCISRSEYLNSMQSKSTPIECVCLQQLPEWLLLFSFLMRESGTHIKHVHTQID